MNPGDTIPIDPMWFRTRCPNPDCGVTYRWHRELKNICPNCKWDYGFLIDLKRGIGELKGYLPDEPL